MQREAGSSDKGLRANPQKLTTGVTSLAGDSPLQKLPPGLPTRKISLIILMLPGSHPSSAFPLPESELAQVGHGRHHSQCPWPSSPRFWLSHQLPAPRGAGPICVLFQRRLVQIHFGPFVNTGASLPLPNCLTGSLTLATHQRHQEGLGNYYGLLPEALMRLGQDTTQTLAFLNVQPRLRISALESEHNLEAETAHSKSWEVEPGNPGRTY